MTCSLFSFSLCSLPFWMVQNKSHIAHLARQSVAWLSSCSGLSLMHIISRTLEPPPPPGLGLRQQFASSFLCVQVDSQEILFLDHFYDLNPGLQCREQIQTHQVFFQKYFSFSIKIRITFLEGDNLVSKFRLN
jgi:hypothetical protein